jgi:hypothetical protein
MNVRTSSSPQAFQIVQVVSRAEFGFGELVFQTFSYCPLQ